MIYVVIYAATIRALRLVLGLLKLTLVIGQRTFLSDAYKCQDIWDARTSLPIFKDLNMGMSVIYCENSYSYCLFCFVFLHILFLFYTNSNHIPSKLMPSPPK